MKPNRFGYVRPAGIDAATQYLDQYGAEAAVLAGGQSLLPLMNRRQVAPAVLVDINGLTDLRYARLDGTGFRIGALTRHVDLERLDDAAVRAGFGVLRETAGLIGHLPIRVRGTVGGSLGHADPTSEWCLLAVGLDGEITVQGADGTRAVAAVDFFTGPHRTLLRRGEFITELRIPRAAPTAVLVEHAPQEGHFPIVAALAAVEVDESDTVTTARVAVSGLAGQPVRLPAVERALTGEPISTELLGQARASVVAAVEPLSCGPDDATYRMELAAALVARALGDSLARRDVGRRADPGTGKARDES